MTHLALIKVAPIFEAERVLDAVPGRTLYQRGSLTLRGESPPVLVDHDDEQPIGRVLELAEIADVDGDWIAALCSVDDPPPWMRRGTDASFRVATIQRQQIGESERVLRGLVSEVSVLSPGVAPAEPLASVVAIGLQRSTSLPGPSVPAGRGGGPAKMIHRSAGQVLRVR